MIHPSRCMEERHGRSATVRILIVEPQPETAAVLQMLLCEHGHAVHLARDVEDARRLVTQWEIALVLIIEPAHGIETDTLSTALRTAGYNGRILCAELPGDGIDTLPPR